jgi:phosphatidylserine decarboxylase
MAFVPQVTPDVPNRTWRVLLALLARLPQRGMSRSFGAVADLEIPRSLRPAVLGSFARAVGVDLAEAEHPLPEYPSLDAFFVRRLRAGARRWPEENTVITSPVDGVIGRHGRVHDGIAIQAKGHSYSLADLLGDESDAAPYANGSFLTIYLSPRHYHRIHTPAAGGVTRGVYLPGSLLPVNAPAVMHVPGLFVRNERLVCHLATAVGRVAVVAVGAYNVGRISAEFDPDWRPSVETSRNHGAIRAVRRVYDPPVHRAKGDEIMVFHLGSTVILLMERAVALVPVIEPGAEIRVGEPVAR